MFNPTSLIEKLVDRNDIPWRLGGPALVKAIDGYNKAHTQLSDSLGLVDDTAAAKFAAIAEYDSQSITHYETTGKILPRESVTLAELAHTSAVRKQAATELELKQALGAVFSVTLASGFLDSWRENLYPQIEKNQQIILDMADSVRETVLETESLLALTEHLGLFPVQQLEMNAIGKPVADLTALGHAMPWTAPSPQISEARIQYGDPAPDERPPVWITANGQTELTDAAFFEDWTADVNRPVKGRHATPNEIKRAIERKA